MTLATMRARESNPGVKIGMCGEHCSDVASIKFAHKDRYSYVSCNAYSIPTAKIAAAQARIEESARKWLGYSLSVII